MKTDLMHHLIPEASDFKRKQVQIRRAINPTLQLYQQVMLLLARKHKDASRRFLSFLSFFVLTSSSEMQKSAVNMATAELQVFFLSLLLHTLQLSVYEKT